MAKNVLLTTLSTLDFERAKLSAYFYEENTGEKIYCNGISALEPGIYIIKISDRPDRCGGYKANDK